MTNKLLAEFKKTTEGFANHVLEATKLVMEHVEEVKTKLETANRVKDAEVGPATKRVRKA